MARSCTNMLAHIIFSTKERAPLIQPDLAPRRFAYLGGIARERQEDFLVYLKKNHIEVNERYLWS